MRITIPLSKTKTEEKIVFPSVGIRSWRWSLVFDACKKGVVLQVELQWKSEQDAKWKPAKRCYGVSVTPHWYLGEDHSYYDGAMCFFSLGFMHLFRFGTDCKKCYKDI